MKPANDLTRCPMCSEVAAENDLHHHLRTHKLIPMLQWLHKHNPAGAALVAVMAVIVYATLVAAWIVLVQGALR